MITTYGHLTYCSNIHSGETWPDHFAQLKEYVPFIKSTIAPEKKFGIGLRLSNMASLQLVAQEALNEFQQWLAQENCYVFTMNGFPYGGFHNTIVKDQVHAPDWTTIERVEYTLRMAEILATLLPPNQDGGISTSPLSYRYWHEEKNTNEVFEKATINVVKVVEQLVRIHQKTGKRLHLDVEPEPDGLLQDGKEFFDWYANYLLPIGTEYLQHHLNISQSSAVEAIKNHVQLCYDVCHFAINFEEPAEVLKQAKDHGIKIGKIQISAALKALLHEDHKRQAVMNAFKEFNEPTYLHQVIARQENGSLRYFSDLPEALQHSADTSMMEWRAHFHVPLFVEDYGVLQSTQQDIVRVLALQKENPFTNHLEVETYTWDVLPTELKLPLSQSIIRELQWVMKTLQADAVGQ